MIKSFIGVLLLFTAVACSHQTENNQETTNYLVRTSEQPYEMGGSFSYVNQNGEIVVPSGTYSASYTDTIRSYGLVAEKGGAIVAINAKGDKLYQVFTYDNGPDYIEDGLFRIVENGKIGYADGETGKIIIAPKYTCAFPFENGKAKVSSNCSEESVGEYSEWVSDEWFFIDKEGKKVVE